MKGVLRIVHDIEHDQLQLLGAPRWNRHLPSLGSSVDQLEQLIAAVHGEEDTILAYAFSNIQAMECFPGSARSGSRTHMVYPLHEGKVEYELKPGDYLASMNGDPIILLDCRAAYPTSSRSTVLFERNPFLYPEYEPHPLDILLKSRLPLKPKNWRTPRYAED